MPARVPEGRVVDGVARACREAGAPEEIFEGVSREVARAVPFDAAMWFAVDPATLLAMYPARFEGMDSGYCQVFWHGEFNDHDATLFRDLVRQDSPAATLREATGGRPVRSPRYREFLEPQGFDDELRVAFRAGANTWAVAGLYRDRGRPPFDDYETAVLAAVAPVVGGAVRTRAASPVRGPALTVAPGVMLFDHRNRLASASPEATRWVNEMLGPAEPERSSWVELMGDPAADDLLFALPVVPLLARARAVAGGRDGGPARTRVQDRSGRWLVLHASCLGGGSGDGMVAVVVEPAKSAEIAPIVIEAYGLSPRERDIVRTIARGYSTPEIAAELFLSPHTVRDYIKSVFEKLGVNSRGELVAKIFTEHYTEPMHADAVHVD